MIVYNYKLMPAFMQAKMIFFTFTFNTKDYFNVYVCLLLGVFRTTRKFFTWRHHFTRRRAANLNLYSALTAMMQWGFFSMPHCDTQYPFFNGRTRYTHAERLAGVLSLHVLRLRPVVAWIWTPNLPHARRRVWPTAAPSRHFTCFIRILNILQSNQPKQTVMKGWKRSIYPIF